ncbi:MAG TPA: LPXTG cell wall anchor domain-containing protein, partial [Acidimicrobiia bacterium]
MRGAGFVRHRLRFGALGAAIGLLAPLVVMSPASADSAGTITQFSIPTPSSGPVTAVPGSDGNMWFTEHDANKIGRITPSGVITEFDTPGFNVGPNIIARGPDGKLYFSQDTGSVGRISTDGTFGNVVVPDNNDKVSFITNGPGDGNLWYSAFPNPDIVKLTTAGVFTPFHIPSASEATGMTAGPDGNLWFGERTAELIGRITPAGSITEFPTPSGVLVTTIAASLDGNLWFTAQTTNQIGRITTSGVVTMFPVPTVNSGVLGIATGPDGNMWITELTANQIGRVLADGTVTEYALPDANSQPAGIGTGVDGRLWVVEFGANALARVSTGAPWHVDPGPPVVDEQATTVKTPFARPLVAIVLDPDGTPLVGATITFTAPDAGASGTFRDGSTIATAITDAHGVATSPTLTANDNVGSYTANATAAFADVNATFALTNDPAAATVTPAVATPAGTLPATGGAVTTTFALLGAGLVLTGAGAMGLSRRRAPFLRHSSGSH